MNIKYIHIALNFGAILALNLFVIVPFMQMTLFRNDMNGISFVVSLLLTMLCLQLYQIEFYKDRL